jgi:hypothetical protein
VRYWAKDGVVKDIEAIVTRNSRSAEALAGDLRAQVGCTTVGGPPPRPRGAPPTLAFTWSSS